MISPKSTFAIYTYGVLKLGGVIPRYSWKSEMIVDVRLLSYINFICFVHETVRDQWPKDFGESL